MEELYLQDNNIADISPLSELINLKKLDLSNNLLEDLEPLSELGNLEFVDLLGNEIDLSPDSKALEVIEELEDKGVGVRRERD